jgi:hypothetical protein
MRTMILPASAFTWGIASLVTGFLGAVLPVPPVFANAEDTQALAAPNTVSAAWTSRELRFRLDDSNSDYTCEKFRGRIKRLRRDHQAPATQSCNALIVP